MSFVFLEHNGQNGCERRWQKEIRRICKWILWNHFVAGLSLSLFQALGQWGQSKNWEGNKWDQRRVGFRREKERAGEPVSIFLKISFYPLEKKNCFLCQNVKCQNLYICSLYSYSREFHQTNSQCVAFFCNHSSCLLCLRESLWMWKSLCSWRLTMGKGLDPYGGSKPSSCKNRAKLKQWHIQHEKRLTDFQRSYTPKHRAWETKAWSNWCKIQGKNVSKTCSFLVMLQKPQTWLANTDRFPAFFMVPKIMKPANINMISVYLQQYTIHNASKHYVYGIFEALPLET